MVRDGVRDDDSSDNNNKRDEITIIIDNVHVVTLITI